MVPIALLAKFGRLTLISSVEVRNMIADSSKPYKLRNVYTIRSTTRSPKTTIKFRKCFSKFMIPIALLAMLSRLRLISSVEVRTMIADASKPNKL